MTVTRAALIRVSDLRIFDRMLINTDRADRLTIPNSNITVSPIQIGWTSGNGAWKIVEVVHENEQPPDDKARLRDTTIDVSVDRVLLTSIWTAPTQEETLAEKAARDAREIDHMTSARLGRVLFAMAKKIEPELTAQQFRNWVASL